MTVEGVLLADAFEKFMLDNGVSLRASSLRLYRFNLSRFLAEVGALGLVRLDEVQPEHIRAFLVGLRGRGYSDSTVDQHYRAVQRFFRWSVEEGLALVNPMARVRRPARSKPVPYSLSADQLEQVLVAACQTSSADRDYAMVCLMFDTGLRRGEVVGLVVSDVDLQGHLVTVRLGKMGKGRFVPMSEVAAHGIAEWLVVRDPRKFGKSVSKFSLFGLADGGFRQVFRRLQEAVGFRLFPHALRHTFATLYGGDVQDVQIILGHSDVSTTASIYRHRDARGLVGVHGERSPVHERWPGWWRRVHAEFGKFDGHEERSPVAGLKESG